MGIPGIQIVEVRLEDLQKLKQLARRSFHASFADVNTPENMQLYDDHHFADEQIRSELLNPDSRFFFAQLGEENLGYIKINQGSAKYIWLGVWEHNINALRFYNKNGFLLYSRHIFKLGDDLQTNLLMKLMLQ